jgi:molecular chaperone GrpE (heat shock protein)
MSRSRLLLPLLAVLLIFGACQSEGTLTGEVFIVTEGRENIEMGLVDVKAISASSVKEHLEKRYGQSKEEVKLLGQEAAAQLDSLTLAQERLEQREAEYEEAQAKYDEVSQDYRMALGSYNSSPQARQGDRVAVNLGERIILRNKTSSASRRTGYMSEGELGAIESVKEAKINTFYKVRTNDGEVGWTPFTSRFTKVDEEIFSLKERMEERVGRLKETYQSKREEVNNISDRLEDTFAKIASYRGQRYFFKNLPQPTNSDETGSDGNYELSVEGGVPYYLTAQASRSIGDEEERYYWMVKTSVEAGAEKELNLTNDNLGGVANKKYALSERTLSIVRRIWESSIGLAKEGEELEWEKLIYRTAFPDDTTDAPIPDDLDVPEDELLSDR